MVAVGRELLVRDPSVTDDQLRAYLLREFLVERDREVVLLRSGLWPLAFLARLVAPFREAKAEQIRRRVEEAITQLRAAHGPAK
jgi:hypothetical protein